MTDTNSVGTLAWLVLILIAIAWVVWTVSFLRERRRNQRAHERTQFNDDKIFEAVEEARRDFS